MIGDVANRHLLPADGLSEKPQRTNQRIRIIVGDIWASSRSGQLLVSCLVNLLVRQVGLVGAIDIVAPTTRSIIAMPNGEEVHEFSKCLEQIAAWAVEGRVKISTSHAVGAEPDFTVMIGTKVACHGPAIAAVGDGWRAWVGDPDRAPEKVSPGKANPLGPFLAAVLTAGEIFKRCRTVSRGHLLDANGYSLWSGKTSPVWQLLEDGPELSGSTLRPIHVVGTGAVGNGLAYVVANAQLVEAFAVLIDDDTYDDTSLNRCFLAGWNDIEDPKVDAVAAALRRFAVGVHPYSGTISQYLTADHSELPATLGRQVNDLDFDIVISCVDRGKSRQDVQGLAAASLFGGSTLGLIARANYYPGRPGAACLSCFNPPERDGDKLRALEKKLRDMERDQRAAFLRKEGIDPVVVENYLGAPRCGTVAEAALRGLATRSAAEFSVGFVSLGAALLLSAKLFRHAVFNVSESAGDMTSLNFKNGGLLDSFLGPDDACEWRCQQRIGQSKPDPCAQRSHA